MNLNEDALADSLTIVVSSLSGAVTASLFFKKKPVEYGPAELVIALSVLVLFALLMALVFSMADEYIRSDRLELKLQEEDLTLNGSIVDVVIVEKGESELRLEVEKSE